MDILETCNVVVVLFYPSAPGEQAITSKEQLDGLAEIGHVCGVTYLFLLAGVSC